MHVPRTPRHALAAATLLALAACASTPPRNAALDEANASYQRAAGDSQVARSAPVELRKAQQALQQAETALRAGEERDAVDHYAYLAKQRTEVALQTGKVAQAEQAVADASQNRNRILIDARTRDADKARMDAETQRNQAEAARKLAEERLATAQASQARAASANALAASATARARTLEDQLAQLKAKQTERGMVLTLGDVLFSTGRAELNAGAASTLDQLTTFLRENPERTIQIEGHTDAVGSDHMNQALSERRANSVKNALMDRGVTSSRISARGFGQARPVASNDTPAGRQQNRRVEVVLPGTT
ncbi:MAG TPA: OmpA family protein [Burkholderiales bacterium]|nr:OmpA family protein [Burkholderiales bacterium]